MLAVELLTPPKANASAFNTSRTRANDPQDANRASFSSQLDQKIEQQRNASNKKEARDDAQNSVENKKPQGAQTAEAKPSAGIENSEAEDGQLVQSAESKVNEDETPLEALSEDALTKEMGEEKIIDGFTVSGESLINNKDQTHKKLQAMLVDDADERSVVAPGLLASMVQTDTASEPLKNALQDELAALSRQKEFQPMLLASEAKSHIKVENMNTLTQTTNSLAGGDGFSTEKTLLASAIDLSMSKGLEQEGLKKAAALGETRELMLEANLQVKETKINERVALQIQSVASPLPNDFGKRFSEQIVWLRQQHIQVAELRIHPRDLGSVLVRIDSVGDNTSVNFVAQSSHVRSVLDQNLSQLHSLFSEAGLQLSDAQVSDGSRGGQGDWKDFSAAGSSSNAELDSGEKLEAAGSAMARPIHVIDFFA